MKKKIRKRPFTFQKLLAYGVPLVLIPGLLVALQLGWNGKGIEEFKKSEQSASLFPTRGTVKRVEDGDTFSLASGQTVRLLGINAPDRGDEGFIISKTALETLVQSKQLYLEYDRYQDDKYGRILAWVWIDCENTPDFLPPDYMHKSGNASMPGLYDNPKGCTKGTLVNEKLVREGFAKVVTYKERGALKYEERMLLRIKRELK